jgi:hypothetical protein
LTPAMRSKVDECQAWERFCREQAARAGTELQRHGLEASADYCRGVAEAIERTSPWTQFWTQTVHNGIEQARLRRTALGREALKKLTQLDQTIRNRIAPFVFQDRCLKPLGHPSFAATSII